jgi:cellulose synthase/poly-beta-1,6-N-acetylglucosamine synthase-like glycosyltransferase
MLCRVYCRIFLIWVTDLTVYPKRRFKDFGFVTLDASILIAARNEEDTILRCLQAIERLNYPPDRYEVLIGNDQSEDKTGLIIENFIRDKPQFRLFLRLLNGWENRPEKPMFWPNSPARPRAGFCCLPMPIARCRPTGFLAC